MTKFIEIPASKHSLATRSSIHGAGINDATYKVEMVVGGVRLECPIYRAWHSMLTRCYSDKFQNRQVSYRGCYVSSEWLTFSNFRGWMADQDYEGKQLDKDIIKSGNKVYSSETCLFVPRHINSLLNSRKSNKGECSVGVSSHLDRYASCCFVNGKSVWIGRFDTDKEASDAYLSFKSKHVLEIALKQDEPLRGYLTRISKEIASGEYFK